jgi:hypothetical protein
LQRGHLYGVLCREGATARCESAGPIFGTLCAPREHFGKLSLGIIDLGSEGCLAHWFRRLGELALTILPLAPEQHWRRERRRIDIQSCWERRRKQIIGRHGTLRVDKLPVSFCFDTSILIARDLLTASPPPHEATAEQEQEHCAAASHEAGQGKFEVVSQEAAL